MNVDEIKYDELDRFQQFFYDNCDKLSYRINKLKDLEGGTLDYWTYYDMILVQFRALFIESPNRRKNYTGQNYLVNMGQEELANQIEEFLNREIADGITLRTGIKVSVDKFIVHNDDIKEDDLVIEHICRARLTQPDTKNSIYELMQEIAMILLKGLTKAWASHISVINRSDD